ncbi:MAG: hypothetical protein ACJ8C4_05920 [Gemmataceae bacterium]
MLRTLLGFAFILGLFAPSIQAADEAQITVVAILANDRDKLINSDLKNIAAEVQKKHPGFTGFRLERQTVKKVALKQKEIFPLIDDVSAEVTVNSYDAKENKSNATIKAPHSGEVTYAIAGEKYVPIVTRYQTKDKDTLIYAVMIKPLPAKPADKEKEKPGE